MVDRCCFNATGSYVSLLFIDKDKENEQVYLMDASNLGTKVKIDDNQRTILSSEETQQIISYFKGKKELDGFSILVDKKKIVNKKYSFSAGQYFQIKIDYEKVSEQEYNEKIEAYTNEIVELFNKGLKLEKEIFKEVDN